jgi:hypothetical protein
MNARFKAKLLLSNEGQVKYCGSLSDLSLLVPGSLSDLSLLVPSSFFPTLTCPSLFRGLLSGPSRVYSLRLRSPASPGSRRRSQPL